MKRMAILVLSLLPLQMGATINLTVTPNPGGNAQQIKGSGTWGLAAGETYTLIQYAVVLKNSNPQQTTSAGLPKQPANNNWSITLSVVAGTYNPCTATLFYKDALNTPQSVVIQDTADHVVN